MEKTGLPSLLMQLYRDALGVFRAEMQLVKSKTQTKVKSVRNGVILLCAAAVIAMASLGGLITGLVMELVPLVGGALAGLIVLAGGLVIAGLLGWLGAKQFSNGKKDDSEKAS